MFPNLPEALLKTLLLPLASMLLAASNNDGPTAMANAMQAVKSFRPRTEPEIRLAIRIATFSIQANEALAQASMPDLPLPLVVRLRQGAVTLTREADKAERRLEKIHAARQKGETPPAEPPQQPEKPSVERAVNLVQEIKETAAQAKAEDVPFNQAYRLRNLEKRRAKQQEREARLRAAAAQSAPAQNEPPVTTTTGGDVPTHSPQAA